MNAPNLPWLSSNALLHDNLSMMFSEADVKSAVRTRGDELVRGTLTEAFVVQESPELINRTYFQSVQDKSGVSKLISVRRVTT